MKAKITIIAMMMILCIPFVFSIIPQDDFDLKEYYNIYNVKDMTVGDSITIDESIVCTPKNGLCNQTGTGAVDSVNGGNKYVYTNPITGDVYVYINETNLNSTIDNRFTGGAGKKGDYIWTYNDSSTIYWNETKGNETYVVIGTKLGNTTEEIISSVNNSELNASNFFGYLWNNIVSKPFNTISSVWFNVIGGELTINDSKINQSIEYLSINETFANNTYINKDGDSNITGTHSYQDATIRLDDETNFFFYDTTDEAKHLNSFAEDYDELRVNVFTELLNISTFYNSTGDYIYISTLHGSNIKCVLSDGSKSNSESFDYNNITLKLNSGTNQTPVLNRIYVAYSGGIPTWFVSTSEADVEHAMAARVLLGDIGNKPYVASLKEDASKGSIKRTQRTFRKKGLLYESGLDYNATSTDINISSGNIIMGINDQIISNLGLISESGFYVVEVDGDYVWYDNFLDLVQNGEYSDGSVFGTNKYINIMVGITPYDGHANYNLIIQSKPPTEYTSTLLAYSDNDNTLKILPSENFIRINYIPVARMILNTQSGEAQILPNTMYAEDYRGGIAGGVSSGGGLSESDPLSLHTDGSVIPTDNFNWGGYSILNLLDINASGFYDDGINLLSRINSNNLTQAGLITSNTNSISTETTARIGNDSLKANLAGGNSFTGNQYIDGNIGINTIIPAEQVHIAGNNNNLLIGRNRTLVKPNGFASNGNLLIVRSEDTSSDAGIGIRRGDTNDRTIGLDIWLDAVGINYIDDLWNSDASQLTFRTKGSVSPVEVLTIRGSGNVGIGTTTPSEKLNVVGNINVTGNIKIGNACVQEWNGTCFNTECNGNLIMSLGCTS